MCFHSNWMQWNLFSDQPCQTELQFNISETASVSREDFIACRSMQSITTKLAWLFILSLCIDFLPISWYNAILR